MKKENKTTTTATAAHKPIKTPPNPIKGEMTGAGWNLRTVTVAELSTMVDNLPPIQLVRGSVWPDTVSEGLINDLSRGAYVPPIVLGGLDAPTIQDGQQRSKAITAAYKAGKLSGNCPVLVAVDTMRTAEECFRALNLGVPVSKTLVAVCGYNNNTRQAILDLAGSPVLDGAKWTGTQMTRTAKAAHAAGALAIMAGWGAPESNERRCNEWLMEAGDIITAEDVERTAAAMKALSAAVEPYYATLAGSKTQGVTVKAAKALSTAIRRRGYWLTMWGAIAAGENPENVVGVFGRRASLLDTKVDVPTGKRTTKKMSYKDYTGGGTSGSNTEYADKVHILRELCKLYAAAPDADDAAPTDGGMEATAATVDAATVAAADGIINRLKGAAV